MKKIIAWILCAVMLLSMAACTNDPAGTGTTAPATTAPATTAPVTEPPVTEPPVTEPPATEPPATEPATPAAQASVNFEDGNLGFVNVYAGMANSDASTLEIVDYNGSKALKVTNGSGKVPYVAFDVWSLLGENAANVRSIEMTMGIENPDGEFYACSGEVILWESKKLSTTTYGWSVYLATKNPKNAVINLKDYQAFSADVAPIMIVSLKVDNGATAGVTPANLFIDDIRFLDADGNVITADSTVAFAAPDGFSGDKDMSNLQYLKATTVSLDGMSGISGTAWGQNGVEMTEEFIAALVPGAVVEIEFASTAGDIWIVMPWANAGWIRVQQMSAATNNSKNVAQITFEQIAAACGSEDVSTWGAMFQCESSGDWEVYSVKVGQASGLVTSARKTVWCDTSVTGGAWGQNGIDLTQEMIDALVPGTMIEVAYTTTSATGDMWIVMPDSAAGWMRVQQQTAACNGSIMQITYEQIAAACGEDKSTWGTRLQLESDGDWEAYTISLVTSYFMNTANNVAVDGFAVTGSAWSQNGIELTAEQQALLVPGSVITIQYTTTSATGDLWIVMPWSTAGWIRVEQMSAACNGSVCQITFEQIAAACGSEIPADWGTMLQCESDGDWEVFSLSIGTAA